MYVAEAKKQDGSPFPPKTLFPSGKQHETVSQILAAKENVTYQQQFSMQSNSIISMPVPQPHYSFSNCNVTFNSFHPGYQQNVGASTALTDVTNSVVSDAIIHHTHVTHVQFETSPYSCHSCMQFVQKRCFFNSFQLITPRYSHSSHLHTLI